MPPPSLSRCRKWMPPPSPPRHRQWLQWTTLNPPLSTKCHQIRLQLMMPHPDLQARRVATSGSGVLPPWTPSCSPRRGQGNPSTGCRSGLRQLWMEAWLGRRGNPSAGWCVWCGYIVPPRQVGSVRTVWFHLVQPGSDRLAHMGLC
jgi:hypothetical protein